MMQMAGANTEAEPDNQQYLDVQRHAAAVQLHSRSLAIAQLRAMMVMPRGGNLAIEAGQRQLNIKPEPGKTAAAQQLAPRQGVGKPAKAITLSVSSTAADLQLASPTAVQQQQQQSGPGKFAMLKPRPLVRRLPDTAAAMHFQADELPEEVLLEEGQQWQQRKEQPDAAARVALAPRIVGDPALIGHQLAGWVKVAGSGGEAGASEGMDAEELLGPGLGAQDEDDLMDEEEWI